LVLDNFETLWQPASTHLNTEEFWSQLAGVPQLAVLVSLRQYLLLCTEIEFNVRSQCEGLSIHKKPNGLGPFYSH
jgi:hypothetical protein